MRFTPSQRILGLALAGILVAACSNTPAPSRARPVVEVPHLSSNFLLSEGSAEEINASVAANPDDGSLLVLWTEDHVAEAQDQARVRARQVTPAAEVGEEPQVGQIHTIHSVKTRSHSVDLVTAAYGTGLGHYLVLWDESEKWPADRAPHSRPDDYVALNAVASTGKPITASRLPLRLTNTDCGAMNATVAFDPIEAQWLVLWREHDGKYNQENDSALPWQCNVDGPWLLFGNFVTWSRSGPQIEDEPEIDFGDASRAFPRAMHRVGLDSSHHRQSRFEVIVTSVETDEALTFWPPRVDLYQVTSPEGQISSEPTPVLERTWGVLAAAATPVHGTPFTFVTWTRDPGGDQPSVTEARLIGPRRFLSTVDTLHSLVKSWDKEQMGPIIRLASHQAESRGMGNIATAMHGTDSIVVVWEEIVEEERHLWVKILPFGTPAVRARPPFSIGTGTLHPDGHSVACVETGCLIAFERSRDIYGRFLPMR